MVDRLNYINNKIIENVVMSRIMYKRIYICKKKFKKFVLVDIF